MAISQNFPDESPSLALNFAQSKKLDSRIVHYRTTTATYLDDNGLLVTAPINTPRFDHSYNGSNFESLGLLVEEAVTNYATHSEDTSIFAFSSGVTISTNTVVAPDGTTTADTVTSTVNGGSNNCWVEKNFAVPNDSSRYVFSCFIKPGTSPTTTLNLQFGGGTYKQSVLTITWSTLSFSYTAGEMGTVTPYPNGWYRISLSLANNNSGNTACAPRIYVRDQGSSNVSGHFMYVWGWQVEKASSFSSSKYATSYIPTTTASVTRGFDWVTIQGSSLNTFLNQKEGTLFSKVRFNTSPLSGLQNRSTVVINSPTMFLWQMWWETTFGGALLLYNGNTASYEVTIPLPGDPNVRSISVYETTNSKAYKLAGCYKVNDFAFCQDGGPVSTDTAGAVNEDFTGFVIGDLNQQHQLNGTIEQILYYPKRLSNAQLQQLTR